MSNKRWPPKTATKIFSVPVPIDNSKNVGYNKNISRTLVLIFLSISTAPVEVDNLFYGMEAVKTKHIIFPLIFE